MTANRSFRITAAALLTAGVVVGAVAASDAATRSSFTPPAKLGALIRYGDVKLSKSGPGVKQAKRQAAWDRKTAAAAAAAYGGATATAQDYTTEGFSEFALLVAVKGPSPKLFVPYSDPVALGLVKPFSEVRTYGDVQCQVQNDPTIPPKKPAADSVHVAMCQRSGPHLTVQIRNVSGDHLSFRPDTVAQMVDQAFAAMS